jgi:hypothetical protein
MDIEQEFLVLDSNGDVAVYTVRQFPRGTPIGPDAKRLTIVGPSRVPPPVARLTRPDFDRWRQDLELEGLRVTLSPYWTGPNAFLSLEEFIRRGGKFRPIEEVCDELLRQADGRGDQEA